MCSINLQYSNEVSAALFKTEISKIKVSDSRKTTSALPAVRFSTLVVRQAVIALLVSFSAFSLLDTHRGGSLSMERHFGAIQSSE
jgi:hypothetical protein